jgi:hypothetical protein
MRVALLHPGDLDIWVILLLVLVPVVAMAAVSVALVYAVA